MIVAAVAIALVGQAIATPAAPATPKPVKECRTTDTSGGLTVGTIMPPSRVCKTPEQWAKLDAKRAKSRKAG